MQFAMIGLGRMGGNMVERLLQHGHQAVVFDRSAEAVQKYAGMGAAAATELADVVRQLAAPRVAWVMVPAGAPTDSTISELAAAMSEGDVIVDGGNSNFKDTLRRSEELKARGIELVDAGTSGGIWGLKNGYALMVGGSDAAYAKVEPILRDLAPERGLAHVGPTGAGHYVKMVHNGIEYGMMQAYGEGYEVLHASRHFPDLDLHQIAGVWNHGSVVRSWLCELAALAFEQEGNDLAALEPYVEDSGEGRWTVEDAIDKRVPTPVITESLYARFASRQEESYAAKVNAALRNQFGGHAVKAVATAKATPQDPR
jgi:6-phosphogluconate dehydrogenase